MSVSGIKDLGPTGEFPEGKLNDEDAGALRVAVAADLEKKVVLIDFGTWIKWVGMTKAQAVGLADMLKEKASQLPD